MAVHSPWASIWRASVVLLVVAVGGCQAERPTTTTTRPTTRGPFPVTVTDDLGHRVTVKRAPQRIVSLAPNVTEMLFALRLGDRIVGVTEYCNYPPEAKRKPKIGGYARPSAERILSMRPDLVVASRGNPPEVLRQVGRAGVPVYGADPQTIAEVIALARKLGLLTGQRRTGDGLASALAQRVAAIASKTATVPEERRPQVLLVVSDQPLFVAGTETYLDDLIRTAGGRNAAAAYRGFSKLGQEAAATLSPDVILTTVSADRAAERIKRSPLGRSPAARQGRIHALNEDIISRPGPRVADALEQIAALLRR